MSKKPISLDKKRKSKNRKAALKRLAISALVGIALAGMIVGGKHVYDGRPHYKVGECLLDEGGEILFQIQSINDGKYQFIGTVIALPFLQMQGEMGIREFNKAAGEHAKRANCQTGQPL